MEPKGVIQAAHGKMCTYLRFNVPVRRYRLVRPQNAKERSDTRACETHDLTLLLGVPLHLLTLTFEGLLKLLC